MKFGIWQKLYSDRHVLTDDDGMVIASITSSGHPDYTFIVVSTNREYTQLEKAKLAAERAYEEALLVRQIAEDKKNSIANEGDDYEGLRD
jgi:hypothetical protein